MATKKQIIKLKKTDLNQALVRGLKRAAYESKSLNVTKEQIHLNPKRRISRYKKDWTHLEDNF